MNKLLFSWIFTSTLFSVVFFCSFSLKISYVSQKTRAKFRKLFKFRQFKVMQFFFECNCSLKHLHIHMSTLQLELTNKETEPTKKKLLQKITYETSALIQMIQNIEEKIRTT